MKHKKLKILALPLAIASASVIGMVSGTLAYFTSQDKATVSIEAGQVKVSFSIEDIEISSLGVVQTATKVVEIGGEQVEVKVFENGGYAYFDGAKIYLDRITPGDKVKVTAKVKNDSNVKIAYHLDTEFANERTGIQNGYVPHTGDLVTATGKLSTGLVSSFEEEYEYSPLEPGAQPQNEVFTIELPAEKGDQYQGASSDYILNVNAIQWNAYDNNIAVTKDSYYPTIQEAVNAVEVDGETHKIKVRKDLDLELSTAAQRINISGNRKVELDFGSNDIGIDTSGMPGGGLYPAILVASGSELTVSSNGDIDFESNSQNKPFIFNQGKVTINNGDFTIDDATFVLNNGGTVVINDGTYAKASELGNDYYVVRNHNGSLTINDGVFTSAATLGAGAIILNNSATTINGGYFEHLDENNNEDVVRSTGGTMNITGGTFKSNSKSGKVLDVSYGTVTISGTDTYMYGEYADVINNTYANLTISGGTFELNNVDGTPGAYVVNHHENPLHTTTTITGGTFKLGDKSLLDSEDCTIGTVNDTPSVTISGGTFTYGTYQAYQNVWTDKNLDEYTKITLNGVLHLNSDGTYSVVSA